MNEDLLPRSTPVLPVSIRDERPSLRAAGGCMRPREQLSVDRSDDDHEIFDDANDDFLIFRPERRLLYKIFNERLVFK